MKTLDKSQQNLVLDHITFAEKIAKCKSRRLPVGVTYDDLRAAAYLGLCEAASRYIPGEIPFESFAYSRVFGRIQDFLRGQGIGRRKANSRGIMKYAQFGCGSEGESLERLVPSGTKSLSFDEIVEGIPPLGQEILRYYYVDGMKLKQIGERLGVGESRVSQLINRFREQLRKAA